jgi:type VI secretion system secreted protein Hcp
MPERWFLKVDGIPGESTDDRHRNEIDVTSWSFGVTNAAPGRGGGGGTGTGRPAFDELHVDARINSATPLLFKACASGQHIRTAVLTGERVTGAAGSEFLTYALEDVTIRGVEHADTVDAAPTDRVALGYGRIRISYRPQNPDGSLGAAVTAGWDVRANHSL